MIQSKGKIGRCRKSKTVSPPVKDGQIYCPLCRVYVKGSFYLRYIFDIDRQYWLATMISHYRHNHYIDYDQRVDHEANLGRYEAFKHLINERIKRNLLKNNKSYMNAIGITVQDVKALRDTTEDIIALARTVLRILRPHIPITPPQGQTTLIRWIYAKE